MSEKTEIIQDLSYHYTSPERIRELLGIRSFDLVSDEKLREFYKTNDLYSAYMNINTTTHPRKQKIEVKKGNAREIMINKMISEEILKTLPTVYLGSGIDIEYPLALGSRNIVLFDPIFQNLESKKELFARIEKIIKEKLPENLVNSFSFFFDFGNGDELVEVEIIPEYYKKEISTQLPEKVGLVIMFASQDHNGQVKVESNLESKIVDGGAILADNALVKIRNGQKELVKLGK